MLLNDLIAHYRQLAQQPLTVVDVETTGQYADKHRVIEVSVLRATIAEGIQAQQTYLVNPGVKVPEKISRFTGITQDMVDQGTPPATAFPACLPLLSGGVLTAHNLKFDYAFLQAEYARLGMTFDRPEEAQLCTVRLARQMLPELPSRRLPDLVRHFEFSVGTSHRAEADTIACWLLVKRLLSELLDESDEVLHARFAQLWMPIRHAAKLLGCTPSEAKARLNALGAPTRTYGQRQKLMYQRGDIDRVWQMLQEERQLDLLPSPPSQ